MTTPEKPTYIDLHRFKFHWEMLPFVKGETIVAKAFQGFYHGDWLFVTYADSDKLYRVYHNRYGTCDMCDELYKFIAQHQPVKLLHPPLRYISLFDAQEFAKQYSPFIEFARDDIMSRIENPDCQKSKKSLELARRYKVLNSVLPKNWRVNSKDKEAHRHKLMLDLAAHIGFSFTA